MDYPIRLVSINNKTVKASHSTLGGILTFLYNNEKIPELEKVNQNHQRLRAKNILIWYGDYLDSLVFTIEEYSLTFTLTRLHSAGKYEVFVSYPNVKVEGDKYNIDWNKVSLNELTLDSVATYSSGDYLNLVKSKGIKLYTRTELDEKMKYNSHYKSSKGFYTYRETSQRTLRDLIQLVRKSQ